MEEHPDTVPGFMMQSQHFFLKFVTGMQQGQSSKLLEFETDWFDMMEILLSRLEDEPEDQQRFQQISSTDLEHWALLQPGGDTLNLKIRVELEERGGRSHRHLGTRKAIKLTFNDRYVTQVLFYVRKKRVVSSLRRLAAAAVVEALAEEEDLEELAMAGELPRDCMPTLHKAWNNCWTARWSRAATATTPCGSACACQESQAKSKDKRKKDKKETAKKDTNNAVENKRETRSSSSKLASVRDAKTEKMKEKIKVLEAKVKELSKKHKNNMSAEKVEDEYAKLQKKYKSLQTTYKQLKKEEVVKSNLQTLKEKYHALEDKVNKLKQSKEKKDVSEGRETRSNKRKHSENEETSKNDKESKLETGAKSFSCKKCQESFGSARILSKHMKLTCTKNNENEKRALRSKRRTLG